MSDDRLIVLGHLIGDGCYLARQPLHYTNSEPELIEEGQMGGDGGICRDAKGGSPEILVSFVLTCGLQTS